MKIIIRKAVDLVISKCITPSLQRQGLHTESLISKAARFAACEVVEGDYLEFGVYQGTSLISSFKAFQSAFNSRISQSAGADAEINRRRNDIWREIRFFAFDSFQGLPPLEEGDIGTQDFKEGMYACSIGSVKRNIAQANLPLDRFHFIEGWFSNTCTLETAKKYNIKKASVIWIDGDLYSSTRDVLNFIKHFLQDGTILIFDDWFSYRGSPKMGEQKAFYEWSESSEIKNSFRFQEYQRESWKRISFIANKVV